MVEHSNVAPMLHKSSESPAKRWKDIHMSQFPALVWEDIIGEVAHSFYFIVATLSSGSLQSSFLLQ